MALNVTLIVVGGDVKTPEVKLRLPSTVGRGRDCSIMLRHPLVSRQHCEIFEAGGALLVRDLGSLNGTFVNNQRIEGDAPLHPGQLLTIGTVTFRAMYDADDTTGSPPTTPALLMKQGKPSSETDSEGTISARPTLRNPSPPNATPPTEPVDVDEDFSLDDAKPLFAEFPAEKTSEDLGKNGNVKGSGAETVYAPTKGKPPTVPPPTPAAEKTPEKPAAKPAEKPAAKAPEKPAPAAPSFDFVEAEDDAGGGEDDDDLNDFLKNLK
jgi:predicted component of type VI protein secretion system